MTPMSPKPPNRVILRELGVEDRAPEVTLAAGSARLRARCALDLGAGTLGLPPAVMSELGTGPGHAAHVLSADGGRRVYFGPIVGLWLGYGATGLLRGGPSGNQARIVKAAREAGVILAIFESAGVDRRSRRLSCLVERDGRLASATLPLPDVIYNRAVFPDQNERARAAALRRKLALADGVILINSANSYPKWETYEALRFFADTADLAPETVLLHAAGGEAALKALENLAARHLIIFLKSNHGSHGAQVVRLLRQGERWLAEGRLGRPVRQVLEGWRDLRAFARDLIAGQPWIAQQGIELPRINGGAVDARAFAQRDGLGEWRVPRVLVRVGAPGLVVASVSQGGYAMGLGSFLDKHGDDLPEFWALERQAKDVVVRVAQALEARYGLLGEVAADLAVDRSGRIWVLEANAKPLHRQAPGLPGSLEIHPLEYAVYLAGRAWAGRVSGLEWPVDLRSRDGGPDDGSRRGEPRWTTAKPDRRRSGGNG